MVDELTESQLLRWIPLLPLLAAAIHGVLNKGEPRWAIAWVALFWRSPFLGCLVYLCFGVNRITRKALSLGVQDHWRHARKATFTRRDLAQQTEFAERHPTHADLANLVGHFSPADFSAGSQLHQRPRVVASIQRHRLPHFRMLVSEPRLLPDQSRQVPTPISAPRRDG